MVSGYVYQRLLPNLWYYMLTYCFSASQLSREEEETAGDEIEVRREDQDKINKFSRLHQHELSIEEELKAKHVSQIDSTNTLQLAPMPSLLTRCG